MTITINGGAGITFPDTVQQTNGMTMTGGNPLYYAARAWVSFNGTNGAIFAQANIESVSRTATGRYTVTIATDMPDANYAIIATSGAASAGTQYYNVRINSTPTTGSFTLANLGQSAGNPAYIDPDFIHVVIFR